MEQNRESRNTLKHIWSISLQKKKKKKKKKKKDKRSFCCGSVGYEPTSIHDDVSFNLWPHSVG